MYSDELKALFDQQASGYDKQWAKLSPIRDGLHFLLQSGLERMRAAWERDVVILPPAEVASIIESGGFEAPVRFFQAGLIHAWFARRA
jgi:hypothetical protein